MFTIGVYDSGIGGLSTMCHIIKAFSGIEIVYFADNLHHPLGALNDAEALQIVNSAVKYLHSIADVVVLACNTASTVCTQSAIRLLPPPPSSNRSLLLATDGTKRRLGILNASFSKPTVAIEKQTKKPCQDNASYMSRIDERRRQLSPYLTTNTSELATLIEEQAEISYRNKTLDMSPLDGYLRARLTPYVGVDDVIIGCSHYSFAESEIAKILGNVKMTDGNARIISELRPLVTSSPSPTRIRFLFSYKNESPKYEFLLSSLLKNADI